MNIDLLLARLDLGFYLLGVVLAFLGLLLRRPTFLRWVPAAAAVGLLLHGISLIRLWSAAGRFPFDQPAGRVSVLAWAAIAVYLLAVLILRLEVLGAIILPLAVVLMLISGFLPTDTVRVPGAMQPGLLWFHISVAIGGVAALALAFGSSVVYLIQERGLKSKRPAGLFVRLPSLQSCESAGHRALLWGFPLLTVAIVTGSIWSANTKASYWSHLPQETLSLLAWLILAVILYARLVSGWRGKKAAYLTIVAFAAVLVRMLGLPFLP